jgi:hypothetical protein
MTGIALLFHLVSRQAARGFHRRAIQGAGIAATVFATLTVALLHDVMVILALVCFMGAIFAVLHMLWDDHHVGLFAMGVLFLALELSTAVMYFGRVGLEFLPIAQKAALALIGIWLLVVQHRPGGQAVHLARPT